jgi:hypothetical protein
LIVGSSSGLIIAFVVVVWAAYFIPLALRRYDEASKNASVESTGGLSRVISRTSRTPQTQSQSRTQPQAQTPTPSVVEATEPQAERIPVRTPDRPAARLAARRRRRTLLTLVALTAIVGGLAGFSVIAPYWVAAPVALVVAWLTACRIQVRRERGIVRTERSRAKLSFPKLPSLPKLPKAPAGDKPARVKTSRSSLAKLVRPAPAKATAADEEDTVIVSGQFEDIDPGRKHEMEDVPLAVDALDDQIVIAVPSISTAGEALWDPLPVTLPTYVTKPRAGRTVRTIDFSQPNTWTSGHIEGEDVELPKRDDDTGTERRAVGH